MFAKRKFDYLLCAIAISIAFGLVYWASLTFVYVEGDDAETIAHHALGRDTEIAPRYADYQSMFDDALTLLPARENVVRITAMTLTALSTPVLIFLIFLLAFDWCDEILPHPRWPLAAMLLLAVPEFYYLGLVLEPPMLAMAILVGSHLVARRSTAGKAKWIGIVISVLLFGFGAALRWDTVKYGLTIAADLFFRYGNKRPVKPNITTRFGMTALWGLSAGLSWIAAIRLNGLGPAVVLRTVQHAELEALNWKSSLASIQTLFTPAFAAAVVLGLYLLFKRRHALAFVTLIAALPVAKMLLYGAPKYLITWTPCLLACGIVGFSSLWRVRWQRLACITVAVLPWIFGLRVAFSGVAWGPGFEIQPYDSIPTKTTRPSLTFGPGTAVPTREGPRPLFGHMWVLGGSWKKFVRNSWSEQEAAVDSSIQRKVPILLLDPMQGWVLVRYAALGLMTEDSFNRITDNFVIERRWHAPEQHSTLYKLVDEKALLEPAIPERLRRIAGDEVIVIGFSRTLNMIYGASPSSLDRLGATTAVLHLDRLSADIGNRKSFNP